MALASDASRAAAGPGAPADRDSEGQQEEDVRSFHARSVCPTESGTAVRGQLNG